MGCGASKAPAQAVHLDSLESKESEAAAQVRPARGPRPFHTRARVAEFIPGTQRHDLILLRSVDGLGRKARPEHARSGE